MLSVVSNRLNKTPSKIIQEFVYSIDSLFFMKWTQQWYQYIKRSCPHLWLHNPTSTFTTADYGRCKSLGWQRYWCHNGKSTNIPGDKHCKSWSGSRNLWFREYVCHDDVRRVQLFSNRHLRLSNDRDEDWKNKRIYLCESKRVGTACWCDDRGSRVK